MTRYFRHLSDKKLCSKKRISICKINIDKFVIFANTNSISK